MHTFYGHLSRIRKLTRFTRFIRKVWATNILLSGKFSLFLTLWWLSFGFMNYQENHILQFKFRNALFFLVIISRKGDCHLLNSWSSHLGWLPTQAPLPPHPPSQPSPSSCLPPTMWLGRRPAFVDFHATKWQHVPFLRVHPFFPPRHWYDSQAQSWLHNEDWIWNPSILKLSQTPPIPPQEAFCNMQKSDIFDILNAHQQNE